MRASNERPYSIDCINTCNFALGHNMLFIMQSIFTNWERRLAVRADNIRPNGLWDYTKPLRDLHGLVLAGRYFWVQNLGSS